MLNIALKIFKTYLHLAAQRPPHFAANRMRWAPTEATNVRRAWSTWIAFPIALSAGPVAAWYFLVLLKHTSANFPVRRTSTHPWTWNHQRYNLVRNYRIFVTIRNRFPFIRIIDLHLPILLLASFLLSACCFYFSLFNTQHRSSFGLTYHVNRGNRTCTISSFPLLDYPLFELRSSF